MFIFVPRMVSLLRILLVIISLLGVLFTLVPLILISCILYMLSISLFSLPPQLHYSHLLRVLCYLRGTVSRCLFFPRSNSLHLQTYYDATWASDFSYRHSLSTYCIFLMFPSLLGRKQVEVPRSSAEVELRTMALVTMEVTWLRWLLEDFGVPSVCRLLFYLTI
jgi:hypothetical protein